jgi:hypothetical protein
VEFASLKGQNLGARRWLARGPQGNSKGRTQAYFIFPGVIGACRSRDTGNHREGQECRNDDLHDGLLVHLADDLRPNARDDELLFVLNVCRRSHEMKMLQSRALALSRNASGSIARVASSLAGAQSNLRRGGNPVDAAALATKLRSLGPQTRRQINLRIELRKRPVRAPAAARP